jgi:hypothetical protein
MWGWHRAMRIFDGPDEVHLAQIAKSVIKTQPSLRLWRYPIVDPEASGRSQVGS